MDWNAAFLAVDWESILVPSASLLEIFIRGTLAYVALFLILRFLLKRQTGVIGIADLLVVVLIADAIQNAMAGDGNSMTEGVLLVLTIVFWNYVIDWVGFHVPALRRLTRPPPLLLVKDGHMLPKHMAQEKITTEELLSQLRQQGVSDLAEVERAYIEGDGRMSVLKRDTGNNQASESRSVRFPS
jgi:uncharacterized membrane protein YcaP (DUF421 family)